MSSVVAKSDAVPLCIYIAARGHSGSTMLELLLNRYPKIAALGEVDQLSLQIVRDGIHTKWVGLCSCEARPWNCEIWRAAFDQVSSKLGIDLAEKPFRFPVSDVGLAQEYGRSRPIEYMKHVICRAVRRTSNRLGIELPAIFPYRAWVKNRDLIYRALATRHDVSAIVDASKDAMQMGDLVRYSELPIKVLFLTRDVRGNAWSSIRRKESTAAGEAKNWVAVNSLILSQLEAIPRSSWMQVKYEDLCSDTDVTLDRILSFLGIVCQPVSPAQEQARRHTIAGNQIRFSSLDSIRHDLAWQENLSNEHIADIQRVAGHMARTLRYEI